MNRQLLPTISMIILAVTLGLFARFAWPPPDLPSSPDSATRLMPARVAEGYGQLPLSFEANQGQTGGQVKFLARGHGYQLFLTATEAVLELQSASLRMKLSGANPSPRVEGLGELSGKSHYFIGAEPRQWRANVPTYAKVRYREVYPGVDLIYYGKQQQLEYDFVVAPGADPDVIALSFTGATELRLDERGDLLLRTAGNAYVAGNTFSTNFPTMNPAQPNFGGRIFDAFVTKLNGSGSALVYSTYLGGSGDDFGQALVLDGAGNAYVAGRTSSTNYPTANPVQPAFGGGGISNNDAVITKIADGTTTVGTLASVSAASFLGAELAAESIVAAFGTNLGTAVQVATTLPLPTSLAGTTVGVRDIAGTERLAGLFFVAPAQVNYQIPPGTVAGSATVTITSGSGAISAGTVNIANVAPGLFSANASGQGVVAAVVFRRRADGSESFEPVAQFDAAQNRFVPLPIDLGPATDQVFLIPFGTGLRFNSGLSAVTCSIGGVNSEVLFAGATPGFVGLDQANVRLSRSLIGRGEVDVVLTVDGKTANTVRIAIR